MKDYLIIGIIAAAVMILITIYGCISMQPAPAAPAAPAVTATQTPVPAAAQTTPPAVATVTATEPEASEEDIADQRFLEAAEACYEATPEITNQTTHLAFLTCMQNTPEPKSACAISFKHDALEYTNDDETSAGYARETKNVHLAREAFYKNMAYNDATLQYEPCR
jgi:hypothetical protein